MKWTRFSAPTGFTWLVILPVVFFRVWFRHDFAGSSPYGNAIGPLLFTVGCALWAGVSLAACIWVSQSKIALTKPPPDASPGESDANKTQ
jgi:hypothetical protein